MKKVVCLSLLLLVSVCVFCQNSHISFMGIKLGAPMEETKDALRQKGFTDGKKDYQMIGDFWKIRNASIGIGSQDIVVDYISVELPEHQYVPLLQDLRKKYGMPKKYDDGSEHQYYWDVEGGRIVLMDFLHNIYTLYYWDYPYVKKKEAKMKAKKNNADDL